MYEQSHRDTSGLPVIRIIVCPSRLLIITVITLRHLQSPARQKCQRTEAGERAAITDMQMRQRDVAALDANTRSELLMLKLKMMPCVMMLPLSSSVAHQQSVSQCVNATTASGVDNAASPRLADTAERDYFTLREKDHYAKITEGTQKHILMSSADRVAHIDGQLMQLL